MYSVCTELTGLSLTAMLDIRVFSYYTPETGISLTSVTAGYLCVLKVVYVCLTTCCLSIYA